MKNKKSPLNFANLLDPTNLAAAVSSDTQGLNMSNPRARQIARQRRNQVGFGRGLLGNIGGAVGSRIFGGLFGNSLLKGRTDEYKGSNTYGDPREFDALINKPQEVRPPIQTNLASSSYSPFQFAGLVGSAAATSHLMDRLGGIFGGGSGNGDRHTGVGGLVGGKVGPGSRPASIVDAGSQFDPTAMSAMQGIFGNVSGRQATLGSSGIYALKEHLSPVKNEDKLTAYKDVAKEDTPGYDDGAGGFDYEAKNIANTNTPGYTDKEAEAEFNRMKYITDASIKKGAGAVITVPKNKK